MKIMEQKQQHNNNKKNDTKAATKPKNHPKYKIAFIRSKDEDASVAIHFSRVFHIEHLCNNIWKFKPSKIMQFE